MEVCLNLIKLHSVKLLSSHEAEAEPLLGSANISRGDSLCGGVGRVFRGLSNLGPRPLTQGSRGPQTGATSCLDAWARQPQPVTGEQGAAVMRKVDNGTAEDTEGRC